MTYHIQSKLNDDWSISEYTLYQWEYELMMCTNKKDVDATDIYQWDIVVVLKKWLESDIKRYNWTLVKKKWEDVRYYKPKCKRYEIMYSEKDFGFTLSDDRTVDWRVTSLRGKTYKILWNKYEHNHLLNNID